MTSGRSPAGTRCGFTVGFAMVVGLATAISHQPTFRAHVDLVRLDVLVVRDGRPVPGLTAADFEVRDNGVVQQIDHLSFAKVPLDVMLVLDTSTSVAGETLQHLQEASHAFLDGLAPADRAGLLTFSEVIALRSDFTTDLTQVHAAIARVEARGATSLRDAIHTALLWPSRHDARPMILVFSDGMDTVSWLTPDQGMDVARESEAVVYGVAIRSEDDDDQLLKRVAEATGGRLLTALSSRRLRAVFVEIVNEMKARYIVSYYPQPQPREGWHDVRVDVKRGRNNVTVRRGYHMSRRQ
jgi:Ca-activated chloride channel homolog